MPYGSALGVSAPTVSVTVGPTYATQVNAYLAALKTIVEAKVTPSGFNMTSDLSFLGGATFYSATDLLTTSYEVQTSALSASTYPAALYFAGAGGDLYVNDSSGNQVQITASGILNVSSSGGITGSGYGSGGVAINWSSGNVAYRMFSGTGTYADVVCDDLLLNDGDTNFISVVSPALAADYTITLPAAVPASSSVMVMSSAGTVSASPSGNLATSGTVATGALTVTGAATVSTTLGVTGLITATAGLTAAANQHITTSGTSEYKHGSRLRYFTGLGFRENIVGSNAVLDTSVGSIQNASGTAQTYTCPINQLIAGDRITSLIFYVFGGASGGTRTARVVRCTLDSNTKATIASGTSTTNGSDDTITLSSINYTLNSPDAIEAYWLEYTTTATAGDGLYGVRMVFDHP